MPEPMNPLSGKQKRFLRHLGQKIKVSVVVGRWGFTAQALGQVREVLAHHELVKVRLPAYPAAERKAAAAQLAQLTDSACPGVVGRTVLLFRANPRLPEGRRVRLP